MMKFFATILFAIVLLALGFVLPLGADFSVEEKEGIEQVVHDYLLENPKILIEMTQILREQQEAEKQQLTLAAILANGRQLLDGECCTYMGNMNAEVNLIEFFDYQCGYCLKVHSEVKRVMARNPDIRLILKQLPILGDVSVFATKAVLAAKKQGKDLELHNALMERNASSRLTNGAVLSLAEMKGIDVQQLKMDMESLETMNRVRESMQLAQKLYIQATPAFIVAPTNLSRDKVAYIPGAAQEAVLQQAIEKARSGSRLLP